MKHLFGTDGIRGVAGKFPLSSNDVYRLGLASGEILKRKHKSKKIRVLIVRDTRESGMWIAEKLSAGLRLHGIDVYDAGILSTPSVAHLVQAHGFQSGVVVSASHNPPQFNGIKFFTPHGTKWPDDWEQAVERIFSLNHSFKPAVHNGAYVEAHSFNQDYADFLVQTLGGYSKFPPLRVAVDCSHGANSELAPALLRRLGMNVFVVGAKPTGKNINVGCGSQHTEKLSRLVRAKKCDLGIAFDGDGDRLILVDEKGSTLDGDHIIALLARTWKRLGTLKKNTVVITVMANLGLKKVLKKMRVKTIEVSVGDRFVSEAMRKKGAVLGGEQSGHIILGQFLPTGDGLLTALHILKIVGNSKLPLSKMLHWMKKYPQILVNVPVKKRVPLEELIHVRQRIKSAEKTLGDNGRVLVRYSGTEPLLRIMIEGPDKIQLQKLTSDIAQSVKASAACMD